MNETISLAAYDILKKIIIEVGAIKIPDSENKPIESQFVLFNKYKILKKGTDHDFTIEDFKRNSDAQKLLTILSKSSNSSTAIQVFNNDFIKLINRFNLNLNYKELSINYNFMLKSILKHIEQIDPKTKKKLNIDEMAKVLKVSIATLYSAIKNNNEHNYFPDISNLSDYAKNELET